MMYTCVVIKQSELDDLLSDSLLGNVSSKSSGIESYKTRCPNPVRLETLGNNMLIYNAPWFKDNTPEAYYLGQNSVFVRGSLLPRGKCKQRYKHRDCSVTISRNLILELKDLK